MKLILTGLLLLVGLNAFSNPSAPKGEIIATASMPGTIKFVLTGSAAEAIYNKLSAKPFEDVYYGPGNVLEKIGQGIRCSLSVKLKNYECEFDVIEKGILLYPDGTDDN